MYYEAASSERTEESTEDSGGRRVAVFGVASEQSIGWHIARALMKSGCRVYLGYQQRFHSRVLPLLRATEGILAGAYRCDLTKDEEIEEFSRSIGRPLHGIVHSVAFAPPATFLKEISEIEQEEFAKSLDVSCFSLLKIARRLKPLLSGGGSIVAMTYIGAQRVVAGYGLMGVAKAALEAAVRQLAVELGPADIRVNAISSGPIRTLSAMAVPRFEEMLERYKSIVPLRRCVAGKDVAAAATFLLSPASRAITGQIIFVDAGFSVVSLPIEKN